MPQVSVHAASRMHTAEKNPHSAMKIQCSQNKEIISYSPIASSKDCTNLYFCQHHVFPYTLINTGHHPFDRWDDDVVLGRLLHCLVMFYFHISCGISCSTRGKEPICQCKRRKIPGLGRSPGVENGNPLQYSCLENPMDRGAWWVTFHGVTNS